MSRTSGSRSISVAGVLLAVVTASWTSQPAVAASIDIAPRLDTTLYEDGSGGLSNGAGAYLFAGQASGVRRALLSFDVASSIPAGSTIVAAELLLHCSRRPYFAPPAVDLELHRVLAAWGEGSSDAGEPGGTGTAAAPGDGTWIHTFYPGSFWSTPGGDFDPVPSGGFGCGDVGSYTVASTAALVADVQRWLDDPGANFGWILIGAPAATTNARRFDSRENPDPAVRPVLRLEYELPTVQVGQATWSALKALFR